MPRSSVFVVISGLAVPLIGAPLFVAISTGLTPYGVNGLALVLAGFVYLPVGLLSAAGGERLRLLAGRISRSRVVAGVAVSVGAVLGSLVWAPILVAGLPIADALRQVLSIGCAVALLTVTLEGVSAIARPVDSTRRRP